MSLHLPCDLADCRIPKLALSASIEEWTDDRVNASSHLSTPGTKQARRIVAKALRDAPDEPIVVCGPTGYGKSLLLKVLRDHPPGFYVSRLLPFAHVAPENLPSYLVSWLSHGPQGAGRIDESLAALLGVDPESGRRTLLLVDELQATPPESFVRLLDLCHEHGAAFVGAGLSGRALEDLLGTSQRPLRRVDFADPWDQRDTTRYLDRLASESGLTSQQLAGRFDLAALLRKTAGNPRLVRAAVAARLRTLDDTSVDARFDAASDDIGAPASSAVPPAPASESHAMAVVDVVAIPDFLDSDDGVNAAQTAPRASVARGRSVAVVDEIAKAAGDQPTNRAFPNDRESRADDLARRCRKTLDKTTRALRAAVRWRRESRRVSQQTGRRLPDVQGLQLLAQRTAGRVLANVRATRGWIERAAIRARRSSGLIREKVASSALATRDRTTARIRRASHQLASARKTVRAALTSGLDVWTRVTTRARQTTKAAPLRMASWFRRRLPTLDWQWLAAGGLLVAAIWVMTQPSVFPTHQPPVAVIGAPTLAPEPSSSLPPEVASGPPVAVSNVPLRINAMPWALVELDGTPIGSTPLSLAVSPGRHHIEAEMSDGRILERTFVVSEEGVRIGFR